VRGDLQALGQLVGRNWAFFYYEMGGFGWFFTMKMGVFDVKLRFFTMETRVFDGFGMKMGGFDVKMGVFDVFYYENGGF
jgi:hypothetical protein